MRTLKFNDDEFPITSTGEVIIIAMDELHSDFLRMTTTFQERLGRAEIPQLDLTAKLMYCMLKAANPNSFKSFKTFMQQNTSLSSFLDVQNLAALNDELNSAFAVEQSEETDGKSEESEQKSKKKANH